MDRLDRKARSDLMSKVRSKDTKPELAVRSYLHARGLRFRLHATSLPGKPDLVFKSRRAVVFVHGCFWHGHKGCPKARVPKTRASFWAFKMRTNSTRDAQAIRKLRSAGWHVFVVWQCQLTERRLARLYQRIDCLPRLPATRMSPNRVSCRRGKTAPSGDIGNPLF